MTFADIEKLIREEARKVVEDLERSFSLSEEEEEPAADTSTAETPTEEPKSEEKPEEKPEEKSSTDSEEKSGEDSSASDSESADEKKPEDDKKDKEEKKPEEKPKEPNEEKTGLKTVGFVNKVDAQSLGKRAEVLYPQSREKLLGYDFEEIIDFYDSAVAQKKDLKKLYKKVESIASSKHGLISNTSLDRQTITALQHYYKNSDKINNIVRYSQPSIDKKEIEKQIKLGIPKEGDEREKLYNSAMNAFTIYELDYAFTESLQTLDMNIVSYRSVKSDDVLQAFLDAGQWVDKSFVTTSLNPLICEGTGKKRLPLFEFFIPAGTSVLTLPCHSNDYCHETEVTLPRNCRYTIQGYNSTRNIYKVLVEQQYGR